MRIRFIHISTLLCLIWMGCNSNSRNDYFFLAEYPELVFTDEQYNPIPTRFYISHMSQNGMSTYIIQDHSLTLRYRRSQEPYSGFIRTYHWGVYNIEAIFEEGKIERLRYWHPNRQLAMDMDYQTGIGSAWTSTGALAITWEGKEIQYRNITTNKIKQIKNDSLTYYFDFDGELKYYTTINDTSYVQFYADGSPRFMLPIWNKGLRTGLVRRWHPNGEIQVTGRYLDGEEFGIWIEYDSLGKEVDRVEY